MSSLRGRALIVSVVCLVLAVASSGCSSSSGDTTGVAPGEAITVAVVADSEIPDEVATLLGQTDGIDVTSAVSMHGATMAELDPEAAKALASGPDVLVWSGGANDLPAGPLIMLEGVKERLARYGSDTCVVFAVPVFRYKRGTPEQVAERTSGTRILEQAGTDSGAVVASYLDVSIAMDAGGRDFFAQGELGDLHPGPQAYPDVAAAIADAVNQCPSTEG